MKSKAFRIFAADEVAAAERVQQHAQVVVPGGKAVDVRLTNILDDPDAEKAEVKSIRLRLETGSGDATIEVTSFEAANRQIGLWRNSTRPSHLLSALEVKVVWENEESYEFIDLFSRVSAHGLATIIQRQIALVFGEFVDPGRDAAEQEAIRAKCLARGAASHCRSIREHCLLRDAQAC